MESREAAPKRMQNLVPPARLIPYEDLHPLDPKRINHRHDEIPPISSCEVVITEPPSRRSMAP
jgi:hypothetical protein